MPTVSGRTYTETIDQPLLDTVSLASASPRRRELLASLGLRVLVVPSRYVEEPIPDVAPRGLALIHAKNKAAGAAAGPHVVVAADTVVDVDGTALGKPVDGADAARMLAALAGRTHCVHTAFALALPGRDAPVEERVTTGVRFFALSPEEIAEYVATGEPMDKAGAYGIQGRAAALVESIDGDFYTVMGFPLGRFIRTVRRLGFALPAAKEAPNS